MSFKMFSVWVVQNGECPAQYLAMRDGLFVFFDDIHDALWLVRRADADRLLEPGWAPVQHIFMLRQEDVA